jgi:hypothetical protein
MRRSDLVERLAVACLVAIWSFATWAQVIDSTPCQKSCYDQKSLCVSECGTHNNPVECEARCDDQLADCLRECR